DPLRTTLFPYTTLFRSGKWQDEDVKSSLDLCLSCKGCKSDCPVSVDVATYKAEFLAHHYQGHWRPLSHYALAHIDRWAVTLASRSEEHTSELQSPYDLV